MLRERSFYDSRKMAQQNRGLQWQDYEQTTDWTSEKNLLTGIILSSFLIF